MWDHVDPTFATFSQITFPYKNNTNTTTLRCHNSFELGMKSDMQSHTSVYAWMIIKSANLFFLPPQAKLCVRESLLCGNIVIQTMSVIRSCSDPLALSVYFVVGHFSLYGGTNYTNTLRYILLINVMRWPSSTGMTAQIQRFNASSRSRQKEQVKQSTSGRRNTARGHLGTLTL